ncbi:hypothetical protein [Cecembia sp.]|uniref:hypothetical protein n=1 Tax=Cecembia sp. TaxID=1898110 RepID=UPI0025BFF12F|nr:hypothetical protein [Cecembia sp.]
MPFFPKHNEVLVSSLTKKEVLEKLELVTKDPNFLDYEARKENGYQFNGTLKKDSFRISLVITKADSFLPLIKGKLDDTPSGSILFLEYSLFPGSVFFLGFWSVVTILLFFFFGFTVEKPGFALISIAIGVANYVFAWSHFKRKIKTSQRIFLDLLNL